MSTDRGDRGLSGVEAWQVSGVRNDGASQVWLNQQRVLIGARLQQVWDAAADFDVRRPIVLTSRSVAGGAHVQQLLTDAPSRFTVDLYAHVAAHTPVSSIAAVLRQARNHQADGVIAIGGGSVIDAAKIARLEIETPGLFGGTIVCCPHAVVDLHAQGHSPDRLSVPSIVAPVTLSQAEFTAVAGFTGGGQGGKRIVKHASMRPSVVLLDPSLACATPRPLWTASAVKALDSGVYTLCGLMTSSGLAPGVAELAIATLWEGLGADLSGGDESEHRRALQIAAWLAIAARWLGGFNEVVAHREWPGAVFRHQLGGALGLSHSETAGALFPALLERLEEGAPEIADRLRHAVRLASGDSLSQAWREQIDASGVVTRLSDLHVTRQQLEPLGQSIDLESNGVWDRRSALELLLTAL